MPVLYDHRGREIRLDELSREIATAAVTSVRTVWRDSVASSITPEKLANILSDAAAGDAEAYLTLAEEMEEREPHYHSVLGTRRLAVGGLPVEVRAAGEDPASVRHTDAVRGLTLRPEFQDLVDDALDALGKGYSVLEIMWDRSGLQWEPIRYEWRDQRFFRFDRETGRELRLQDESDLVNGVALPPYKFIIHTPRIKTGLPIRGGLARIAAASYLCKSFDLKDWMAFLEVFGLPMRVGRYGPGATDKDIRTLIAAVANLGSDAGAVIPKSMEIEFPGAVSVTGNVDAFERLADWVDRQTSKAVIGQTMTSDDGSSKSQAEVHNDVRKDLLVADGKQLSKTINRDLVRPYIDLNFGPQKLYPYVAITLKKPEDLKLLSEALPPFLDRGLRVAAQTVLEKFGLPEPTADQELLGSVPSPAAASSISQLNRLMPRRRPPARQQVSIPESDLVDDIGAEAQSDWRPMVDPMLKPVARLIEEVSSLDELRERLPEVLATMDTDELVHRLAVAMFKSRGVGDGSDTA